MWPSLALRTGSPRSFPGLWRNVLASRQSQSDLAGAWTRLVSNGSKLRGRIGMTRRLGVRVRSCRSRNLLGERVSSRWSPLPLWCL